MLSKSLFVTSFGLASFACSSSDSNGAADAGNADGSAQGGERQPCYPNATCNAGLTCLSDVCVQTGVDASTPDGSTPDGSTSDASTSDAAACTPGAVQCSGNGVETCGSNAQWGTAVACGGGTPFCVNGACTGPASCQTSGEGRSNCGAGESCCTSLPVAGATYSRTYVNSGSGATGTADPATVSNFRLDKYEVTVGRFRPFAAAWNANWRPTPGSGKHTHVNAGNGLNVTAGGYEPGWVAADNSIVAPTDANLNDGTSPYSAWTPSPASNEKKPMNRVNWWESYAFCIWDGGFLPSEAEWEYAAAGGTELREYPWGTAAPGTTNQYAIYGCNYPTAGACSGIANIAPVGTATAGAGKWGQLDLAGSMWEWSLDWEGGYTTCTDCTNLAAAAYRVSRGGNFEQAASLFYPSFRNGSTATFRSDAQGFRCARTP